MKVPCHLNHHPPPLPPIFSDSFCRAVPRTYPPTKQKQPNTNQGFNFQGLWNKMRRTVSHEPGWPRWPGTAPAAAPFPLRCPRGPAPGKTRPPGDRERQPGRPSRRHAPAGTRAAQSQECLNSHRAVRAGSHSPPRTPTPDGPEAANRRPTSLVLIGCAGEKRGVSRGGRGCGRPSWRASESIERSEGRPVSRLGD